MASSRQDFFTWQEENKENVRPQNHKLKQGTSASDSVSLLKTVKPKTISLVEKQNTVRGVFNENYHNYNVKKRHLSLTSEEQKKSVENVEVAVKRRLHSFDSKENTKSVRFAKAENILVENEENENANKNRSTASSSSSKFGVQAKLDKAKLNLHVKLTSSEPTDIDQNWRQLYHPRILNIQQNEGTITPVDFSIPPFLEKVKELHKRNTKDASAAVATDKFELDVNGKTVISKKSYDLDDVDKYIEMQIEREKSRRIVTNLANSFINVTQRKILIDFLMRVNTYRQDPPFILYQAVKIFDTAVEAMKIKIDDLQVTALAAMWISIKRDHVNIPTATSMIAFGGKELKEKTDILQSFECRILKALNFDISYPDVSSILAHFIFTHYGKSDDDPRIDITYHCGNFFIDNAIRDETLNSVSAILLAGVAAILAFFLVENPNESLKRYFRNEFSRLPYATKFQYGEVIFVRKTLCRQVCNWRKKYSEDSSSTFKKYAQKRYSKIKELLLENIKKLETE